MDCNLDYIPTRLHTKDKPVLETFGIGEELYYRCKENECQKPYDQIPLFDISHNRNFSNKEGYPKEDVLFNINEADDLVKYDSNIVVLIITELENSKTYFKELKSENEPGLKVHIKLLHDPVPCMYTHSVFEISINETIISKENYKKILGKKNIKFKNLRSDIRQELSSIIQTGRIDSSQDIEFLDEL